MIGELFEPQLVDAGVANLALVLGFIIGCAVTGIGVLAMKIGFRDGFKRYLQEQKGEDRKDVEQALYTIMDKVEFLANRTNTKYFKSMHNQFIELMGSIRRKWLNY